VLQKNVFSFGFWVPTCAISAFQIFLKLPSGPADEMSANSKKSGAGKGGNLNWPEEMKGT
jgi:hypothetical protein